MNKQFFTIIILALTSQSQGMDRELYPHDYKCQRHHHNGPYPHYIPWSHLTDELLNKGDWRRLLVEEDHGFRISEAEDRAYDQFIDGKAPLVIARKAFYLQQPQELESLKQQIAREADSLHHLLGKPIDIGATREYLPEGNSALWLNLRGRLANPPTGQIQWWKNKLTQYPAFWQAVEKGSLTANIFGNKKSEYFRELLLPHIAKWLDAVFFSTGLYYRIKIEEKDAAIEAAQRALTPFQQAANANADRLRELEPHQETYLRGMRQNLGRLVDASQAGIPNYQMQSPTWAQNVANRLLNPPADQIQSGLTWLQDDNSAQLCELIIKKSQVDPTNAKAIILAAIAHARDASIQAYACPLLEKLSKANADKAQLNTDKTRLEEQGRKTQADLEATQKAKADAESTITRLTNEKRVLVQHFEDNMRGIEQQANQRNQQSGAELRDLQRQISPLRRELPALRDRVREQNIQIQELRNALAARNQQQP